MLVLRRIHVAFTLFETAADKVAAAERAHEVYKLKCPVYRSLHQAIAITSALEIRPAGERGEQQASVA